MPSITPVYGFPYPFDTDPVHQGAKHIRDIAQKLEATLRTRGEQPAGTDMTDVSRRLLALETKLNAITRDTGWVPLPITTSGWTTPRETAVRRIGDQVFIRGMVLNPDHTGGWTTIGTIPLGFRPLYEATVSVSGNTNVALAVEIAPSGLLRMYSQSTSTAWRNLAAAGPWFTENAFPSTRA